jgi:hypothetical protein
VAFDQTDRAGLDARVPIRTTHCQGVTSSARGSESATSAVTRKADRLDHRIDPVAVALGIHTALEHDDAGSFARDGAIRSAIKRPGDCAPGQGTELGEYHREVDVACKINPANEREVCAARLERTGSQIESHERRRAGRVNDKTGSREIKPMCDSARCRVCDLRWDRRRPEWWQTLFQVRVDRLKICFAPFRVQGFENRNRLRHDSPVLQARKIAAIEVVASADDDLDAPSILNSFSQASVRERGTGRVQDEKLFGFAALDS